MRHIQCILLAAYLVSCNSQTITDSTSDNLKISENFKKEIPIYQDGKPNLFYNLTQQKTKQLQLDTLQNGYDSLQIRIWYDYSLVAFRKLLIITRTNSMWTATVYTMTVKWDYKNLTEKIESYQKQDIIPKNGWDSFVKQIFQLQITTLPNMQDIPGLVDEWTDGITYNVEIATKEKYRFYGYHFPDYFQVSSQYNFWQAKNMVDILKLIEAEFDIKFN